MTPSHDRLSQISARIGGVVLADAAGEDDHVDSVKRGDHRGDLLADRIAEHIDGQAGVGIDRRPFVEASHVAANARNSQQAGAVVDQLFQLGGIEFVLTHQVDQNAGIQIAGTRAHDHAASGGQPHAGVDRFAILDRGDAGAVAEMGNDQALGQIVGKLMQDGFAGQAVKAIALDALGPQFLGQRQNPRDIGQVGVKCRIEAGYVRNVGELLLRVANDR